MGVLEWDSILPLQQQVGLQAWAVEAEDANRWALDTLLALVVVSMPPTAQPLPMVPQGLWVPPVTLQWLPTWPWEKVL